MRHDIENTARLFAVVGAAGRHAADADTVVCSRRATQNVCILHPQAQCLGG